MNYFAHFYFDYRENQPFYNLGLILPDLARGLDGKKKLHLEAVGNEFPQPLTALKEGCNAHLKRDLLFHDSQFFTQNMAMMEDKLKAGNFPNEGIRLWFLVHVGVELLLDRMLMAQHSEILDLFYEEIKAAEPLVVAEFLSVCGKTNAERYPEIHAGFTKAQYLRSYMDERQLMFALNRLLTRTGQRPMNSAQDGVFTALLPEFDRAVQNSYSQLLDEMKQI